MTPAMEQERRPGRSRLVYDKTKRTIVTVTSDALQRPAWMLDHEWLLVQHGQRKRLEIWRLHVGYLGQFFDWITGGWWARAILHCPRPE